MDILNPMPAQGPGAAPPVVPEPALAAPESGGKIWGWAVAGVILLIWFAWAGSARSTWPRTFTPWTYSDTGWMVPARGVPQILICGALLYAVLCGLARRALRAGMTAGLQYWVAVMLLGVVALEIHLILIRAWSPLLEFSDIVGRGVTGWRVVATIANVASLALLILALHARKQSVWLAALFVWHPFTLLAGPVTGSGVACALPLLVLAAFPWRWHRWMRELLILTPAALAVWWIAHSSLSGTGPVNGLAPIVLRDLSVDAHFHPLVLILFAAVFEGLIFWLATRCQWPIARAWGHILIVCLLLCPRVDYRLLLPMIVLAPIALVPSAWLATGTALLLFLLKPAGGNVEAEWVLFLAFIPVWVVEIADLCRPRVGATALPARENPAENPAGAAHQTQTDRYAPPHPTQTA